MLAILLADYQSHQNLLGSILFYPSFFRNPINFVILLTNQTTNQQTKKPRWKLNFLGGCNNANNNFLVSSAYSLFWPLFHIYGGTAQQRNEAHCPWGWSWPEWRDHSHWTIKEKEKRKILSQPYKKMFYRSHSPLYVIPLHFIAETNCLS